MDSSLEKLRQILLSATEGMTAEQLRWHPEGKWCAAEVLEHLYLSYTGTIKGFERALEAGQPNVARATVGQRLGVFLVLGLQYFPAGRKSPKSAMPRGLPAEQVKSEVADKIAAMDATLARCEQRLGRGKLLDHPILGPLSAAQWRKFHLVHGRHHARQIARLREQAERAG